MTHCDECNVKLEIEYGYDAVGDEPGLEDELFCPHCHDSMPLPRGVISAARVLTAVAESNDYDGLMARIRAIFEQHQGRENGVSNHAHRRARI